MRPNVTGLVVCTVVSTGGAYGCGREAVEIVPLAGLYSGSLRSSCQAEDGSGLVERHSGDLELVEVAPGVLETGLRPCEPVAIQSDRLSASLEETACEIDVPDFGTIEHEVLGGDLRLRGTTLMLSYSWVTWSVGGNWRIDCHMDDELERR